MKEGCWIVVTITSTITIGRRKGVVSLQQPLPPLLSEDGEVLCRCSNCLHHCHWKKERCCVDITTASTITTKGKDYLTISGRKDQCLAKQKLLPPSLLKEGKEQYLATLWQHLPLFSTLSQHKKSKDFFFLFAFCHFLGVCVAICRTLCVWPSIRPCLRIVPLYPTIVKKEVIFAWHHQRKEKASFVLAYINRNWSKCNHFMCNYR